MDIVYLSRSNLLTLLSKLDRAKNGESSSCAIIKSGTNHPKYPQSRPRVLIQAIEDKDYYTDRKRGIVHPLDEKRIKDGNW